MGTVPGPQVRCPRCQTPFSAQVINVVDARLAPQLKAALLGGYLNRVECPACGTVAVLNVPLVYHDPDKELLLVLMPAELNLSADQQQRLIGGLVQAVMNSVPADQRKGYFLRPQTILSLQRLTETILEADGVTPEMIEDQNRRLRLLSELLQAAGDDDRLTRLIDEHRAELDYGFLATLVSAAEESALAGDGSSSERLLALRDRLLQDPELAGRLPQPLPPGTTIEQAVAKLLAVAEDDQALAAMVAINRPAFDYLFFQGLTAQLESSRQSGDTARAERLTALRTRLLEEIDQQDQALKAAQQQDMQLIEELLRSPDRPAAIRQHLAQIDTLFLNTLGGAIQAARHEANIDRSARLEEIRQDIVALLAEAMPPELRLVNRLLGLERTEERQAVLAESSAILTDELLSLIDSLLEEVQAQGRDEVVRRLETIRAEIQAVRTAAAAPGQPV